MIGLHPTAEPVRTVADSEAGDDRLRELLFFDMLDRGWYLARRGFIALSLAVTDRELDDFLATVRQVLAARSRFWSPAG
jgi:glutamate-1-semialdehyde 2,1-aminomutase